MYFVFFKDDFGDKHIAQFKTYQDALDFYSMPSNVVFTYDLLSLEEVFDCVRCRNYHR